MKNKFMRTAAMLLVLTLVTTCMVGGTFAKYITVADYEDSARVAKFGVVLTVANESSFSTEYTNTDNKITVKSSTEDKLVAPGTADAEGITFSISGTPEVATKLDIAMNVTDDVFLKKGEYEDYTTAKNSDKFTLSEDYYPVKFTLKQTAGVYKDGGEYKTATAENPFTVVNAGKLSAVETAVEAASIDFIKPNHALDSTYVLTWAWDFPNETETAAEEEGEAVAVPYDKADTYLGWLAAAKNTAEDTAAEDGTDETQTETYSLDIKYDITFTVTQID